MWIGIVTAMPHLIHGALADGVIGRATESGALDVNLFNIRDHASDNYGSIDDRPFGGSPGMLMMAEPLAACTEQAMAQSPDAAVRKLYFSPQGETLTQELVRHLAEEDALILVSGRYEGVDERYIKAYIDQEISIGDYVVSGGELPALVLLDAVGRLLEGTLGNEKSASDDSFGDNLLEGPQYTRPREWRDMAVPEVLTSGNHAHIEQWRHEQALSRTWRRRPELLTHRRFNNAEKAWLKSQFDQTN